MEDNWPYEMLWVQQVSRFRNQRSSAKTWMVSVFCKAGYRLHLPLAAHAMPVAITK